MINPFQNFDSVPLKSTCFHQQLLPEPEVVALAVPLAWPLQTYQSLTSHAHTFATSHAPSLAASHAHAVRALCTPASPTCAQVVDTIALQQKAFWKLSLDKLCNNSPRTMVLPLQNPAISQFSSVPPSLTLVVTPRDCGLSAQSAPRSVRLQVSLTRIVPRAVDGTAHVVVV